MNPKVFVSHASEDKERFVLAFAEKLRDKGIDAWLDKWEMLPGDSLVDKIFEEGIKEASAFIVILSLNSAEKPWVKEELNAAFVKKLEGKTKLIPIIIDECVIPECLKSTLYSRIDPNQNYDEEFNRIVLSIMGQTQKPALGQVPAYMKAKGLEVPGIDEIDNKVLFRLCEIAISADGFLVEQSFIRNLPQELGMTVVDLDDSLNILHNRGYIKGHMALGTGIFMVTVINSTIEKYLKATLGDISHIYNKICLCILNDGKNRSIQISDHTGLELNIVNFALEQLDNQGLIKLSKQLGGMSVAFVSPELKRKFR